MPTMLPDATPQSCDSLVPNAYIKLSGRIFVRPRVRFGHEDEPRWAKGRRILPQTTTQHVNLPEDAWEKQVANTWIVRVRLEVKVDQVVTPKDREFVMDINAWYKEFIETHDREVKTQVLRELEPKLAKERRKERREGQREGQRKAEINQLVHLFQRRVGRSLSPDERQTLTACVKKFGPAHLMDLVLDSSGPELAAWLETNGVARND